MTTLFQQVQIVLENRIIQGNVLVQDGIITHISADGEAAVPAHAGWTVVDGQGGWLLPGFIDIHVHGGFGADFMDADAGSYDAITRFHSSHGTTGMLATTVTASKEAIEQVLAAAHSYCSGNMPYAALLGVHLEGPFISEKWPGAQNPAFIAEPNLEWLQQWISAYPGLIRMLTLAPEKKGALELISWLNEHGIAAAAGHTDANYEEIARAADAGLTHAVHTFNAMRGLHHREPGTAGAVLTDDRIYAEIIADGEHVHPAAVRLLASSKPADKLILITDAISAAGMPDGEYELGGLPVTLKDGAARLSGSGNLAGSSLTMMGAFRFMLDHTELTVPDVSRLASGNPAKRLGLFHTTGSIAAGKRADLVLADTNFEVLGTWVGGSRVYERDGQRE
ncbi:N-acetylglucosamine-6-phosphate deacetylase [Paenibacillus protaetiae]|uniref:N-acetylglucosamine-6-phosphate deacetylase n=1 Tax=Paenibacillus protaetiae TaxID=2509456 RepID=A0A4P6ESZ5_9BACL|nr:N-acetylglucosamine-6-phosphate deacetylase [Paenibacillus protaetiae]QAY65123.1 N-acetylglucosamine-6-phosphate deacetylase [Paenibacillus protaetiae]